MGCRNCPDKSSVNNSAARSNLAGDRTFTIVYTGGPPHASFAAIRTAIPNDGIIRRYQPTVHLDGRIEYKQDAPAPPTPEGYQADASNSWTLRPIWVSCVFRSYRVQTLDDGILKIEGQCLNPKSGKRPPQTLTNDFCLHCSIRSAIKQPLKPTGTTERLPFPADQPGKSTV